MKNERVHVTQAASSRIGWVDAVRFLGMLAVYIGHFADQAGRLYPFVFIYHVPLFFFAAGFFAGRPDESFVGLVTRLVRRLLLPYVFFAAMFACALALFYDWPWASLQDALEAFALGIRNHISAGSLWFIPCLFVVALLHGLVYRLTRSGMVTLGVSFACVLVSQYGLPFNPIMQPSWALNADSALYYVFWYALGQALFPLLTRHMYRPLGAVLGMMAVAGSMALYFAGTAPVYELLDAIPPGRRHKLAATVAGLLVIALAIAGNVAIAYWLQRIELVRRLGQRTLTLCGVEDFVKLLVPQAMIVVGMKLQLIHPLGVVLYSFACMLVAGLVVARVLELHAPRWSGLRAAGVSAPRVAATTP